MDQDLRNTLNTATQRARRLLEDEFRTQLEGDFDLFTDGRVGDQAPAHLDRPQRLVRDKLLSALAHKTSSGAAPQESITLLLREAAFTTWNRICALKLAEARGLVLECVSKGVESAGYREYQLLAPGLTALSDRAYRLYLECLCDELHQELGALFDRRESAALLWPRWTALQDLLGIVNDPSLAAVWREDETIGWIYQYFNSTDERRTMRAASSAPRNSRELAVRNQFFTPRYVVRFLIDNTLGRLWWLATGGQTSLVDRCALLLIKPDEHAPTVERWRDPRTIRLLDPGCGSMHFGLYAFDVFQAIYAEAWDREAAHGSGALVGPDGIAVTPLSTTYSDRAAFDRDIPRLILAHNIHGVDIDPRAVQVSRLALWLRAQRTWQDTHLPVTQRPRITAIQVIAATAPPTGAARDAMLETLPAQDRRLLSEALGLMDGLDQAGVLLRLERDVPLIVRRSLSELGPIFDAPGSGTWPEVEARVLAALAQAADAGHFQGRLVAEDALAGLRLIDLVREPFDVVVMNPPFGAAGSGIKDQLTRAYPRSKHDLLAMFVERGIELLRQGGRLGAITSRTGFFLSSYQRWREEVVLGMARPEAMADLGYGVMDDAMVEAAAYVLERISPARTEAT